MCKYTLKRVAMLHICSVGVHAGVEGAGVRAQRVQMPFTLLSDVLRVKQHRKS